MSRALRASHDTGRTDRLRRSIRPRKGAGRSRAQSRAQLAAEDAAAPNEVRAEPWSTRRHPGFALGAERTIYVLSRNPRSAAETAAIAGEISYLAKFGA